MVQWGTPIINIKLKLQILTYIYNIDFLILLSKNIFALIQEMGTGANKLVLYLKRLKNKSLKEDP